MSRLVTLHAWRVPRAAVPRALWRMAVDRGRLRRTPGVSFAKLLGTGRDLHFGPADADPTRWAAVIVWDDEAAAAGFDDSPVGRAWAVIASARCRLTLRPVASRGAWAGRAPFDGDAARRATGDPARRATGDPARRATVDPARRATGDPLRRPDGPVVVLTRARLRARQAVTFWRTIPAVAAALPGTPGLVAAFGVGEAPLGWQGTVSVWQGTADLMRFAYRQPEHQAAITATPLRRWYTEELFARFTVLDVDGDRGVLGWEGRDDQG